ncbi:MAG TPA: ABC transporter ATP-binding protein [Ktedonobacterales bacterium]|jgi:ABC-2 type transport system ATP-binding protein|nr:ABC transporter ATP-binding protein [Ktedonobacterales bacterium]
MSTTNTRITRGAPSAGGTGAAASGDAIVVENLVKAYGSTVAVGGLSFSVKPGEIFALLGPNGAGKTTTVEILEGYRVADSGGARVLGLDPRRDATRLRPRVGVMLQQDGLYQTLRAREILNLYASFYADPEDPRELMERVGLTSVAGTRFRQLSGGQKRRLALAVAIVGKPQLLFLDEPTTGMDPQARRATWDIIQQQQARGVTILLTTHFMDEAERLANRIAIIDGGKLIALDTPVALTTSQSTTGTEVRFRAWPGLDLAALGRLSFVRAVREESPGVYALDTGEPRELLVQLATLLRDTGADLTELRIGRSSLEDVFIRLTGKEMRE